MAGILRGSIWALGLGGTAVSIASLVAEQPAGNAPPQMPLVAAPETVAPVSLEDETTPPAVAREFAVSAPRVSAPQAEIIAPAADTEPAVPPQTLELEAIQDDPAVADESTTVATLEEPALETTTAAQPEIPMAEEEAVIATQSAPPRAEVSETDSPTVAGIAEDALVANAPDVVEAPAAPVVPAEDTQSIAELVPEETPEESVPQVAEIAEPEPAPEPESIAPAIPLEEPIIEAQTPAPVIVSDAPETPAAPELAQAEPDTTEPAEPAPAPQANTGRVLRLGVSSESDAQDSDIAAEDDPSQGDLAETALQRFGTAFENPNEVPLLSVLLIDNGANADMATQIAELGLPVTVVLHALDPQAHDRAMAYQAAGVEVAVQVSLPAGAVPTDIEVAFEAVFGLIPEAAILFADESSVLRNNRAATAQVMQVLAADGRGLITAQRGLNAAQQAATEAGVPAAAIMRELDGAGEDEAAIKRRLDQAALRARQTGNAVLLGLVQDTTLAALADWSGGVDQQQLALAPVSAVLLDVTP
ncbi:divergent polysaccharide deacetylase family protein [Yoonia sp. I 8.24]|uniref:divergent polysaccharide deacetylase family protein n=1 Tax=Yoonia sp. I 8.24 TaxID=1537229 RepID=UPI001EDF82DC|nr:divergent polysaccharide deacetylase family protein [Yoonia sp. I 8.24]MCG3267548.1 divergent polysaccharide deacetylase family protein [Yoonia sp. I 8.24]